MRKVTAFFIAVFLISSCATTEKFIAKQERAIGTNIKDYIAINGYPDRSYTLPNGNRVYVYEKNELISAPTFMIPIVTRDGIWYEREEQIIDQRVCKLYLETTPKGKIIKYDYKGNSCVSN